MAKDLPEYQRRSAIQPQAQPQDYVGSVTQANAGVNYIGDIGHQVAKHASQEISRMQAIEAAKTPGRLLLPAFTPSDQAFVETYKAQEYATAIQSGGKELSRIGFESLKRPTAESLALYDQESADTIEQLAQQLTPENAQRVRDVLGVDALNQRYKIEASIFKRDEEFLNQNFQNAYEQTLKSISDAMALDDEKTADIILQTTSNIIDNPDITYNLSASARIKLKEVLHQTKENAAFREEMLEAIGNNKVAEKLSELTNEPFTSTNMRKAEVMLDTYKQNLVLTAARDDLILDGMRRKMAEGTLNPAEVIVAKEQVDPSRFSGFEVEYAKWLSSRAQSANVYDYFVANKDNALNLTSLAPKQLDGAFSQYVQNEAQKRGVEPSLQLEAALAAGVDAPIPSFNKKLNAGINSGNPKVAAMASSIYGALSVGNPNAVSGVTDSAGQKAETWNRLLSTGTDPEQAYKDISKMYDNVTTAQLREREEMWPRLLSSQKIGTIDKQKNKVASTLGLKASIMPEGLALEFIDTARAKYMASGNFDDAWANTAIQMAQIYSQTDFNGFDQVMRNAPDKFMPTEQVKAMKLNRAEQLFAGINKSFDDPKEIRGLYSYSMSKQASRNVPNTVGIGLAGLTTAYGLPRESKIALERKDNSGNITKGILVVMPDKYTDFPPEGVLLSYGMYFKADGQSQFQPIYDTDKDYSNARFNITLADAKAYQEKMKTEDEKYAKQLEEHILKLQQQKSKVIEARLEAGEDLYYE